MPLYEYKCSKCHAVFEVIRKFSDAPLKKHGGCGGKVERLLSAPAFQLRGTGWYATDYKKSSAPASETKSEGNGGAPSTGASESKSSEPKNPSQADAKPAAKPAAEAPAKKE